MVLSQKTIQGTLCIMIKNLNHDLNLLIKDGNSARVKIRTENKIMFAMLSCLANNEMYQSAKRVVFCNITIIGTESGIGQSFNFGT